ncbi:MAG: hypothetical protein JWL81_2362, partial [Verrucomicrobiales bacterium]|nr:hypothetical protein [Verrucomicrobiales bacterium]
MDPIFENRLLQTRRQFFGHTGLRLGSIALASLASRFPGTARAAAPHLVNPPLPHLPHFAPKAKSLIYIHFNGGPPQHDTWDYKPQLQKYFDTEIPREIRGDQRITGMTSGQARFPVAPSLFKFAQHGQCGRW